MNNAVERVLAMLDGFRMSDEMTYSAYSALYDEISLLDDLLKKQEPIKPTVSVDTWICSKCGHTLESQELIDDKENPQVLIHEQYEYCPCCGRKVNWGAKTSSKDVHHLPTL